MRQLLYLEGVCVKLLQGDKRYICAIFMLLLSSTPSECSSMVKSRVIIDEKRAIGVSYCPDARRRRDSSLFGYN